jgi:predicted alpha/beta superfamily hydrolase
MKKISATIICILFFVDCYCQYSVRLDITQLPPQIRTNVIFIAGSFNNWTPNDEDNKFQQDSAGNFFLYYPRVDAGTYEFKFTRGSWQTVECKKNGADIENRIVTIRSDTVMNFSIESWKDASMQEPRKHTASKNVHIIDTAFYIPQLNRHRRIWIYLPPDYSSSQKKYAVLYMQDGQNLFDEFTAAFGEWGIDEALDTLSTSNKSMIVVGIDNGGEKRMSEYDPYGYDRFGKGEGKEYIDFLVSTLKPFIDTHYRTKKDVAHTFIAGSSMGGSISFYAILEHPKIFGAAGIFSPAFWIAKQLNDEVKNKAATAKGKFYFYAGGSESKTMISDMQNIIDILRNNSKAQIKVEINNEGRHNETNWRREFPKFYNWIN